MEGPLCLHPICFQGNLNVASIWYFEHYLHNTSMLRSWQGFMCCFQCCFITALSIKTVQVLAKDVIMTFTNVVINGNNLFNNLPLWHWWQLYKIISLPLWLYCLLSVSWLPLSSCFLTCALFYYLSLPLFHQWQRVLLPLKSCLFATPPLNMPRHSLHWPFLFLPLWLNHPPIKVLSFLLIITDLFLIYGHSSLQSSSVDSSIFLVHTSLQLSNEVHSFTYETIYATTFSVHKNRESTF